MKQFDIKRFWAITRWDLITNKKQYITLVLTLTFTLFIMFAFSCFTHKDSINSYFIIEQLSSFSLFILNFFFTIGASTVLNTYTTKQQRTALLMLPASNREKFLMRFMMITAGMVIIFAIALACADLLRMIFCTIIGYEVAGSVFIDFINKIVTVPGNFIELMKNPAEHNYPVNESLSISALAITGFVAGHATYTLGGMLFGRRAWVITTLTCIFAGIIFGNFMFSYIENFMYASIANTTAMLWAGAVLLAVYDVAAYGVSYRLFKRLPAVNHRLSNL